MDAIICLCRHFPYLFSYIVAITLWWLKREYSRQITDLSQLSVRTNSMKLYRVIDVTGGNRTFRHAYVKVNLNTITQYTNNNNINGIVSSNPHHVWESNSPAFVERH